MAKVAIMTDGLRRKPTYEEVIDYIENDPDKIKYPNRAAKFLRNTFQLSQLDGMGQALLEQQQAEEMKERVKDYQLHQLAIQNDTDARTERAIQQGNEQPQIQQGGSSSSGLVRNVVGGVVGGVGTVARGVAGFLNPFSGQSSSPADQFHTPGEVSPEPQRRASPVPSELDEAIADYESDTLNERLEQESQRSQKTESSRRSLREHLDETHQQQSVLLPLAGGVGLSPAPSYGSIQGSSPAAPTNYYIGSSPANTARSPAQTVMPSPQTVMSSPAHRQGIVVQSSPESVRSSPAPGGIIIQSSPESVRARTEGEYRSERVRRLIDFA